MEFSRQSLRAPIDALQQAADALTRAAGQLRDHGGFSGASELEQLAAATAGSLALVRKLEAKLAYKAGAIPDAGRRPPAN